MLIDELVEVNDLLKQEIYQKVVKISELEDKNAEITQLFTKKIKDLEKRNSLQATKPAPHDIKGKPIMGMPTFGMQNNFDKMR